ncbi:retrotransposon protein, putative, ty1-copia subclass [Tanacetum coccineum]
MVREIKNWLEDTQGKAVDPTYYRGMIGTLMYLTANRPDLTFVVCMCARYQAKPIEKHLHALLTVRLIIAALPKLLEKYIMDVFQNEVENQLGKKIKAIRSDRGGEYLSHEFVNHMKSCGTVSQLTPPYTPQHNRVSKRRNQTLLDMVRSMMNLTTLPKSFWRYAFETVARILNMVPTKKVIGRLMKYGMGKLPSYPKETIGYYFYYPLENKIFVSRNDEFFENSFMVQEASESHRLLKMSGSDKGLEIIQEEDTQPSENTSKEHNKVAPIEVEPQTTGVLIRRLMRNLAFGRHLEEIHVTWAHLEKKQTRLRTYTNISQDYVLRGYSLSTMDNKVGVTSPERTTQTLPSFEEYTPPVTYPEEVEKTLGTPIEVEPLNETKLEEVGLNCNHNTPLTSREVPSFDGPEPQHLLNSLSLDEMFDDDWGLESKEVSPLGEELSLFDRPNEVERGRILEAHRLEPILQ